MNASMRFLEHKVKMCLFGQLEQGLGLNTWIVCACPTNFVLVMLFGKTRSRKIAAQPAPGTYVISSLWVLWKSGNM